MPYNFYKVEYVCQFYMCELLLTLNAHHIASVWVSRRKEFQLASMGPALVYLRSWFWKSYPCSLYVKNSVELFKCLVVSWTLIAFSEHARGIISCVVLFFLPRIEMLYLYKVFCAFAFSFFFNTSHLIWYVLDLHMQA